jgi:hypothetical protein
LANQNIFKERSDLLDDVRARIPVSVFELVQAQAFVLDEVGIFFGVKIFDLEVVVEDGIRPHFEMTCN